MDRRGLGLLLALSGVLSAGGRPSWALELSFEDRVEAQESIERVYYAHQIGATTPVAEALPYETLERRVLLYLRQSVALETFWNAPVTAEALRREATRMAGGTRMAERLAELYAALGDDPVLIQECLARPALVNRLVHGFFASDERIHAAAREAAEALRRELVEGRIDPYADHPLRTVVEFVRNAAMDDATGHVAGADVQNPQRIELAAEEFDRLRERLPRFVGEVSPVLEDARRLSMTILLEQGEDHLRVARFAVAKTSFETWWGEVEGGLDPAAVVPVADAAPLPSPTGRPGGESGAIASCSGESDVWDNGSLDDIPYARANHTAIWTGSLMVVWGGSGAFGTGSRYDPATDTWESVSTANAPSSRSRHTAVWTGSRMIVWGGESWGGPSSASLATGGSYDPELDTWTPTSTAGAPTARRDHTAVWTGARMIVWGGLSGANLFLDSGGRYDPETDSWTPTSTSGAPSGRYDHTAVWAGEQMIVWGGQRFETTSWVYLDSGGRYDPQADAWTPTSMTGAPVGRSTHTAVWTGTRMIVWGGSSFLSGVGWLDFNSGGSYNPAADSWVPTATGGAPQRRHGHTAVWTGTVMAVWGGESTASGALFGTGGKYDPLANHWSPMASAGAPTARREHSAVWTGSHLIVWGGTQADSSSLESGGRYDLDSDTWTPTSESNGAPEARFGHTAVWTGNSMVVWGGIGDVFEKLDTGGRYDPVTDAWAPTSTVDAPAGRWLHTAVWADGRMIAWGGEGATGAKLNTGGSYDPIADTWTPTSTSGAPLARSGHTGVWTGSLMVVWGGSLVTNTGGRYDPVTDTWAPTSMSGAPSARQFHAAVWTGSRMVVWGGNDGGAVEFGSGARYDPIADSWTPTSGIGAPAPRFAHATGWTGKLMIVWGGSWIEVIQGNPPVWVQFYYSNGGAYDPMQDTWGPVSAEPSIAPVGNTAVWTGSRLVLWSAQSGARYHPPTDTWMPVSATNAPPGIEYHSAVWTGDFMVVWGGSTANATGGRYAAGSPAADDDDGDGLSECAGDCDDAFGEVWATPGEVRDLALPAADTLTWTAPADIGGSGVVYDVLRSPAASDFVTGATCVETDDGSDTTAMDAELPSVGSVSFYLVRAQNACPSGEGTLGTDSAGNPRPGQSCP